MILAVAALAWGGASVPINQPLKDGPALGLDWFLLDLLAMALIYVPLERFWPQYPKQSTFRPQWTLDIVYFLSTHLPIQILSYLILLPATFAARYLAIPVVAHAIAAPAAAGAILPCGSRRRSRGMGDPFCAPQGSLPLALPLDPPFFARARLDRRVALAFRRRHAGAGEHSRADDARVLASGSSSPIWCSSRCTRPGRIAISRPMSNGSSASWSCRAITTGIIRRKRKRSTRISRSTFRGSTACSALIIIPTLGRQNTASRARRYRRASSVKPTSRSCGRTGAISKAKAS